MVTRDDAQDGHAAERRASRAAVTGAGVALVAALATAAPAAATPHALLRPTPAPIKPPTKTHGATLARILGVTRVRPQPGSGGTVTGLGPSTSYAHRPQNLLVLKSVQRDGRQWLKVLLPIRPNGSTGWVSRDQVVLSHTRYWITVKKRSRLVTVYRRGDVVRRSRAVIGARETPTPTGLAAIYEKNPQQGGSIGPWALSLTVMSNVLESFGGGPGRVAIHGRSGVYLQDELGSARSHGCIRINNIPVTWIARHVPAGTPVKITNR
jgi:lipoprotein-anchoring transpeptidase ErfK/SrfK